MKQIIINKIEKRKKQMGNEMKKNYGSLKPSSDQKELLFDYKDRSRCVGGKHAEKGFNCQGLNCNIVPKICKACAYTVTKGSDKDNQVCKLCFVTSQMME